ncbi:MAG: hypothetical protein JWR30_536 [Conexibacter sp.]|nr:hypothetical protein [Conexibacter sp.]
MRRLLLPLTLLLVALSPAAAQGAVGIGIADNKHDMFGDARYQALRIGYARIDLRWDVLTDAGATLQLDAWMAGAHATGARPLVTFDRSPRRPSYNPTPRQMAGALKGLRKRYPYLKDVSAWNEANINKRPEVVAQWWLALRRACPTCTVLGTDLLDRGNIASWAQRFVAAAGRTPKVWGLHNYIDANRMATKTTKLLLRSVGGNVWFTETGGIVRRANGSGVRFPTSAARAARVTRFIFDRLAPLSPRIQRVYLYHWDTGLRTTLPATWDSGFVGPDGLPRPALAVLKGVLARAAAAQRR